MVDTVLAGGTLVTPDGTVEASLAIEGETIAAIGSERALPDAETRIDVSGKFVLPGAVDPHVHVDYDPPQVATYPSETAAAALGGVTTVIDFAWQSGLYTDELDDDATLLDGIEFKRGRAESGYVDAAVHGCLSEYEPDLDDVVGTAVERGVTSFKLFVSEYEAVGVSNGFLDRVYPTIADHDAVAVTHTEDPAICEARTERARADGRSEPTEYAWTRPPHSEAMAADNAIRVAKAAGAKYYGVHTTSQAAAEAIAHHRTDGSRVRAETCTHYAVLDESVLEEVGLFGVVAPPIRTPADADAMFDHLADGALSVVSTDHCVYAPESRQGSWWDGPQGLNSLQFSLPVFYDEAVERRGFSVPFVVRAMCTTPARTFGMPEKGTLEPGTDADLVVFDPDARYTISEADVVSNAETTVYDGRTVTGRVDRTFVRGTPVAADGDVVAEEGHGTFLEREIPDWDRDAR